MTVGTVNGSISQAKAIDLPQDHVRAEIAASESDSPLRLWEYRLRRYK